MRRFLCALCAITITSCATGKKTEETKSTGFERMPKAEREFRGLWVATVSNLDWPSARGLPEEQQKAEVLAILDKVVELNLNAVMLQIRPAGDAFYKSSVEPWSIFLTGTMGKDPGYDPLGYWIEQAHARGIQLHAWFNPYRVGNPSIKEEEYADKSPIRTCPDLVHKVGNVGYYWMDPGSPRSSEYVLGILRELLANYDVDGLVMDDYFYPYKDYFDAGEEFPDGAEFEAAQKSGFVGDISDWRRNNIDSFVEGLYKTVKARYPKVLVGISPFGIWRPTYPPSIAGKDAFAEIYTDTRKWLNEGWIDYLAPQLYWPIKQAAQSFPALLEWWKGENEKGRHLWPAINVGYVSAANLPSPEIRAHEYASQIHVARGMLPKSPGFILFRARFFMETVAGRKNSAFQGEQLVKELETKALFAKALVPETSWITGDAPPVPQVSCTVQDNKLVASWQPVDGAFRYVVYAHRRNSEWGGRIWWENDILPASTTSKEFEMVRPGKTENDEVDLLIVTAVNRLGRECEKKIINIER